MTGQDQSPNANRPQNNTLNNDKWSMAIKVDITSTGPFTRK